MAKENPKIKNKLVGLLNRNPKEASKLPKKKNEDVIDDSKDAVAEKARLEEIEKLKQEEENLKKEIGELNKAINELKIQIEALPDDVESLEAKKADIEKRRQEELGELKYVDEIDVEPIEREINAKYDAELTALENKNEKEIVFTMKDLENKFAQMIKEVLTPKSGKDAEAVFKNVKFEKKDSGFKINVNLAAKGFAIGLSLDMVNYKDSINFINPKVEANFLAKGKAEKALFPKVPEFADAFKKYLEDENKTEIISMKIDDSGNLKIITKN